jgi:hypothetical protein
MSEALKNLLACCRATLAADGFPVCLEDRAEGERFGAHITISVAAGLPGAARHLRVDARVLNENRVVS